MRVSVMQPQFVPWAGYWALMDAADVFVIDDMAQYARSWQQRNRVRGPDGQVRWLTIPTLSPSRAPLNEIRIDNSQPWQAKHWRSIEAAYAHCLHWDAVELVCGSASRIVWPSLTDLTSALIHVVECWLGIEAELLWASRLGLDLGLRASARVQNILDQVGATLLVNTVGARPMFEKEPIRTPIRWLDLEPAPYDQGGLPWVPSLSFLDVIAHTGPRALEIVRAGVREIGAE